VTLAVAPYATVVIPTHDRWATLAETVGSVQRQTIRDIQILVVGDGPTPQVAGIGRKLASEDPRVVFLEFEKGPGAGGVNRDRAIREHAAAERIFYTDDDDIWLAEHVATLGPHLDLHHVVDSLPLSVSGCGRLSLACVNSGHANTRSLLAQDKLKLMYDTHLAHRRSTYLSLGTPWKMGEGGDVVRRMLGAFAESPDVSWVTVPIATALSLHGGARAVWSAEQRQAENRLWIERARAMTPMAATTASHPAWQFFFCLNLLAPMPGDDCAAYLGRLGLALPDAYGGGLTLPLSKELAEDLVTVFRIHTGEDVGEEAVVRLGPILLDNVTTAVATWPWLRRALQPFPRPKAFEMVAAMAPLGERSAELLALFNAYLLLWSRQHDKALDRARALQARIRLVPHEMELLLGQIHLAKGDVDVGIDENRPSAIATRLVGALIDVGRLDDAEEALSYAEKRVGGLPAVMALRRRIAAARAG
jgi:hypothetical protein